MVGWGPRGLALSHTGFLAGLAGLLWTALPPTEQPMLTPVARSPEKGLASWAGTPGRASPYSQEGKALQSYLVLVRNGFLDDSLPHWGHSPCGLLVPAQQLPGLCFRAGSVFTCQCPCLGVVASWPTPQEPHSATSPGTLPELPGQQQAAWEEWGSQFFVAGCGSGAACGSFRRTPPSLVSPSLRQGSE